MGGLPILNAKNRQKVQNYRMRSERHELKRNQQERGSSPLPSTSATPDETPGFQVEVLRECEGVLVCSGFYKQLNYYGVMLTGDGPNGTPGPLVDEVTRFRSSVSSYQDSPKTDQWISALADRVSTNGIQLRKRNFMKIYGRMLCASCMMPVPENETIPRRHFIDPNQRKLLKKPRDQPRQHIVAQLNGTSSRHSPHAHAQQRKQMEKGSTDDTEAENGSNGGNDMGPEVCNEESMQNNVDGSEPLPIVACMSQKLDKTVEVPMRANKRKAYKPREACNIVMPAGVDPFEPEYDFSTAFSGRESQGELSQNPPEDENNTSMPTSADNATDGTVNANGQEHGLVDNEGVNNTAKGLAIVEEEGVLKDSDETATVAHRTKLFSQNKFQCTISSNSSSSSDSSNSQSAKFMRHASTIHFKSEKIRNAFLPSYRILETHSDGLHMKLVRQPSEEEHTVNASHKKNHMKPSKVTPKCSTEQEALWKSMTGLDSDTVPTHKRIDNIPIRRGSSSLAPPTQHLDVSNRTCEDNVASNINKHIFKKPREAPGQVVVRCLENEKKKAVVVNKPLLITGRSDASTSSTEIAKREQLKKQTVKGACSGGPVRPLQTDSDFVSVENTTMSATVLKCVKMEEPEERTDTATSQKLPLHKPHHKDKTCYKNEWPANALPAVYAVGQTPPHNNARSTSVKLTDLPPCDSSVIPQKHCNRKAENMCMLPCPYLSSNHDQSAEAQSPRAPTSVASGDASKPAVAMLPCHPPIKLILKPVKNIALPSQSVQSSSRSLTLHSSNIDMRAKTFTSSAAVALPSDTSVTQSPPVCRGAAVKTENKECVKQNKSAKVAKTGSESSLLKMKEEILDESEEVEASEDNIYGLKFGDVVWAKNGTDAYWPGRIHSFTRNEGKGGAAILWFGVATYSPFIDFTRLEPFVDCYANRFNPKRAEPTYHKAVACGIAACLPRKGYFEQKLSPQVHKVLISTHGFDPSEQVKIITKRKRRSAAMQPSHKKRKTTVKKNEGESSTSQENVEPLEETNQRQEVKMEDPADTVATCEPTTIGGEPSSSDDEDRLIIACDDE